MNRIAICISVFFLPFSTLGQDTSEVEEEINLEIYFDPYLGLTKKYFNNNGTDLAFTYGGGLNFSWRISKTIELKSGMAFHTDSYFKIEHVGCEALNYFCLPIKKINNRFFEIPIWFQYQLGKNNSNIQTFISGGFINQLLIHQNKTAFSEDGNTKRDGPKEFQFKYLGGDFYVGLQLRKRIINNTMNLFIEPNLRFSTFTYEDISLEYKYYPKLGIRIGIRF